MSLDKFQKKPSSVQIDSINSNKINYTCNNANLTLDISIES